MKRTEEPSFLQGSLSSLIEKFSQSDVIAVMEKEYQSAPAQLLSLSLLDDNAFVSEVHLDEEEIDRIAKGLASKGFYNPLVVRKKEGGRYEIILGRKRYFAAKRIGTLSLPCAIVDAKDEEVLLMLLADTRDQRESNILEMAIVCHELQTRFHYTQQTLADLSHQSRAQITNTMRILRLPPSLREALNLGKLTYGHAKAIASLPEKQMLALGEKAQKEGLSVREVERLVKESRDGEDFISSLSSRLGIAIEEKRTSVTFCFDSEEEKRRFLETHFPEK